MLKENTTSIKYKNNLELRLKSNINNQTICQHQYTSFPLRLSTVFRLEGANTNRAYLYLINTSPGLLAGDTLNLSLHLSANSHLYLTDQAATKVHPMPEADRKGTINYQIVIEDNASLELVGEPIILYTDASLEQNTRIKIHPTAKLWLTEIVLPGRLAKNEYYDFNYYFNRLEIVDNRDELLFVNASSLLGKSNPFKGNKLFASLPILGNAIAILPDLDLNKAIAEIEQLAIKRDRPIETAATILPAENGIAIRALASKTRDIKEYFASVLQHIRQLQGANNLPYIPK
ncbi:MAG: urease accessory protein UreD [Cyanobacteria bacterium P01_G01_bin.19]